MVGLNIYYYTFESVNRFTGTLLMYLCNDPSAFINANASRSRMHFTRAASGTVLPLRGTPKII